MENTSSPYFFQDVCVDPVGRTVSRGPERVGLTPKEFSTLLYMLQRQGEAIPREALIGAVWPGTAVGDTSLARNISVLRRHFGADCIRAIPKFGYRFECPVTREPVPVEAGEVPTAQNVSHEIAEQQIAAVLLPAAPTSRWQLLVTAGLIGLLAAGLGFSVEHRRSALREGDSKFAVAKPKYVPSEAAHRLYLTGSFELERRTLDGYRHAADAFAAAAAADPKYADAYVGLSQAYLFMAGIVAETECFPKARAASEAALRIDPDNAGAHRNLAYLLMNDGPDLRKSEQEYRTALQLDPHDARTHHWYAQLLAAERRTAESVREASRGYELDPASVASGANYAFMLTQNGQADEADRLLTKLLEREPNNDMTWGYLGFAKLKLGQYRESAGAFHVAADKSSLKVNYLACAAYAMARAGEPSEAQHVLQMMRDRGQRGEWIPAQSMVLLALAVHDRERALVWLRRGVGDRTTTLFELATDPVYSELRREPEFKQISLEAGGPR